MRVLKLHCERVGELALDVEAEFLAFVLRTLLHWSANFDEVQDFEMQIRTSAGGTGLPDDAALAVGTRRAPLGDPKAGLSADLDALAPCLASLTEQTPSPWRGASSDAEAGRQVFAASGCPQCHNGSTFTDETEQRPRDVGTIRPTSGGRLGGPLTGIDVPTLLDAWATPPYLHDASPRPRSRTR